VTSAADRRKVQVLRKGAVEPEVVNLEDVLSGQGKNLLLKDGDAVTVPAFPLVNVKVLGWVTKPGDAELKAGTTILEAITASGGFTMDADKAAVFLTRPDGSVRKVDLFKLDSPDGALPLEDGAKVFVPQANPRRFAVAGGVNEPGLFPMPAEPGQKIYLTDALAQAKGPIDRAKKKNIVVVRKNPSGGQPLIHQIDFEAILKKKDPKLNIEILENDVVYVDAEPEGRQRRGNILERILGIAGAFVGF
jgi:protein involved in polysaccharide export with SLBB domain